MWNREEISLDSELLDDLRRVDRMGLFSKELSKQEHEYLQNFYFEMREKIKGLNMEVVLPEALPKDGDLGEIEKHILETAHLWDDRTLGAEEEFVETVDVKMPNNK